MFENPPKKSADMVNTRGGSSIRPPPPVSAEERGFFCGHRSIQKKKTKSVDCPFAEVHVVKVFKKKKKKKKKC